MKKPFMIGGHVIERGSKVTIDLSLDNLSSHLPANIPIRVIRGKQSGPKIFVSAAVHGDEVIGVEIVRRVLQNKALSRMKGTLIAVPIVNTFGFVSNSRYLPDRRDLNRSFPGAEHGSLAGQMAHLFMKEIVSQCDMGIDLHSASAHRVNLPQIRFCPSTPWTRDLARAFGAPLILEAPLRDGSLRKAAQDVGIDVLLYESGEALRFDEFAVRVGVRGILNVMAELGMIKPRERKKAAATSVETSKSKWVRAPSGGIFRAVKDIGVIVNEGDILGYVSDAFGDHEETVCALSAGLIIGKTRFPIVNPGDALFHIALTDSKLSAEHKLNKIGDEIDADPLFDEDEII